MWLRRSLVAAVAMPLNLALAVASGLPPAAGSDFAGAIGGCMPAFGGSPLQSPQGPQRLIRHGAWAVETVWSRQVAAACVMIGILQLLLAYSGAGRQQVRSGKCAGRFHKRCAGIKLLDTQLPEAARFPRSSTIQLIDLAMMMHRPVAASCVVVAVVSDLLVAFSMVGLSKYKRLPAAALAVLLVTFVSRCTSAGRSGTVGDIGSDAIAFPCAVGPLVETNSGSI